VIVSVVVLGEAVTDLQVVGYALSILGMWAYKNSQYLGEIFGAPSHSLAEWVNGINQQPGAMRGRSASSGGEYAVVRA
jgi:hypothetical protein